MTRALDDGLRQVVILGAGYDARALRLARPSARFFEVDHPATQADKQRRAPAGAVFVPADLREDRLDDALLSAGFGPDVPAVFIVEGLTMYLTEAATAVMVASLAELGAPGSRLAANFSQAGGGSVSPVSRAVASTTRLHWRLSGEPTHYWATTENVPLMLTDAGWTPDELTTGPDLVEAHVVSGTMRTSGVNPKMFCVTACRTPTST